VRTALLAALALFAAAGAAGAGTLTTGLRGVVTRGPITPVCRDGVPCSAPAKHFTVAFTRSGITRSIVTGLDGRYAIALPAGSYAVRIPSARFGFKPRTVLVRTGQVSTRNFSIDTGIR
jgi:hypothetical protein